MRYLICLVVSYILFICVGFVLGVGAMGWSVTYQCEHDMTNVMDGWNITCERVE